VFGLPPFLRMGCGASKTPDIGSTVETKPKTNTAETKPATPTTPDLSALTSSGVLTAKAATPSAKAVSKSASAADTLSSGPTTAVFIFGHDVTNKVEKCKELEHRLGCTYLLTSDLLRNELKAGTELGLELAEMIKQGKITPQHKIVQLIKNAMLTRGGVFLIDGFPKSAESLTMFNENVACERQLALYFELDETALINRIAASDSSLDSDGAAKRAKAFRNQTHGMLTTLTGMGMLHTIDATGGDATAQAIAVVEGSAQATLLPPQPEAEGAGAAVPANAPPKCIFVLGGPGSGKGAVLQSNALRK